MGTPHRDRDWGAFKEVGGSLRGGEGGALPKGWDPPRKKGLGHLGAGGAQGHPIGTGIGGHLKRLGAL